jgi:hypothetical protein
MKSVLDDLVLLSAHRGRWAARWVSGLVRSAYSIFVHRPFRVVALSLAIAVMSGADLYLTLLFVTQTGMNEMNPLARAMMEYQSPAILAVWKMGTVVISVGILLMIRKQRSAELGAWVGCFVMGWLMLHWSGFIENSQYINFEMAASHNINNPTWIMISTGSEDPSGVMTTVID